MSILKHTAYFNNDSKQHWKSTVASLVKSHVANGLSTAFKQTAIELLRHLFVDLSKAHVHGYK